MGKEFGRNEVLKINSKEKSHQLSMKENIEMTRKKDLALTLGLLETNTEAIFSMI